ncbi:MAG TPA: hypothetical protein VJT32_08970 [bacterium]|nr:hypothetical protein [bacterium]
MAKAEKVLWTVLAAYVFCALHDDWRTQNGERGMCILPAIQAGLGKILGL